MSDFLERIAFAGFGGLLLDRWGYADAALEQEITGRLGPADAFDTRARWVFFDLRQFRADLVRGLSRSEINKKEQLATDPIGSTKYKIGRSINFGKGGDSERFKDSGWSGTEDQLTWTEGNSAVLNFSGLPASQPLTLKMTMAGLTKNPHLLAQPVAAYANGKRIADWQVTEKKEYTASIPEDVLSDAGTLTIEFRIPRAASPSSLGLNLDSRILGLCVFHLVIEKGQ